MKKRLLVSLVRVMLLTVVCTGIGFTRMQAQTCSASIPTDTVIFCHGSDFELPVTLSGTAPFTFTYSINGTANPPIVTSDSNYTLMMYPPSTTTVIKLVSMQDATGCQGSVSGTITVKSISIHVNFHMTPVSCIGTGIGSLAINHVYGGTAPYTYLWANGSDSSRVSGPIDFYRVTVTDANGCTQEAGSQISQSAPLQVTAVVTNPSCNHSDGSIDVSIAGGTGPFETVWSNSNMTEDLADLGSGTYTIWVTDAYGCTGSFSTTLSTFDVTIQSSIANCQTNFNVTVTGSNPPYTYLWSNGWVTQDVSGLNDGLYTVTVTDASGCTVKKSTWAILTHPTVTVSTTTTLCNGGLRAQLQGMSPVGATYLWSTGSANQILSNIPAGTYTVTVTASNTCTASKTAVAPQALTNSELNISSTTMDPSCTGDTNGSISLAVSGFSPPFSFQWSSGDTTQILINKAPGNYKVTVTDANGCSSTTGTGLLNPIPLDIYSYVTPATCDSSSGIIATYIYGGTEPYSYVWIRTLNNESIGTSDVLTGIPGGTYQVIVTDSHGCTVTSPDIAVQPVPFSVDAGVLSSLCNSATLSANVSGVSGDLQYTWNGPDGFTSGDQQITAFSSGLYSVMVTDTNGCVHQTSVQADIQIGGPCGAITGKVWRDENGNCLADPEDSGLGGWLVMAARDGEVLYGVSNADGTYQIDVPAGTYTVKTIASNALWEPCSQEAQVTVDIQEETVSGIDLTVKPIHLCPLLEISIGTDALQPCFEGNVYHVSCFNEGTSAASNAYALIALDPLLTPMSSDIPYTDIGEGKLRFDLGDMAPGASIKFRLQVALSCDAAPDQAHCTEAHIYPDGDCIPVNPLWSGASLRLSSRCASDSVRFTIINAGTGNMPVASTYSILKDANVLTKVPFQLASGDSTVVALSADGSTWRMEVDQAPFHPGHSSPALSVEGCGGGAPFSTGFVTQFANDEANPWVDIDCTTNSGSHGSNDKLGMPVGYGTEHYVRPATEIEYMIRFQNTGMDTAFRVRVVDSLASWLDVSTIRPGPSSHPYKFNLTGSGIAEFLFENIQLPDSNTNEAASHSFVKFSIYPKAAAPLETLIENTAHIYFDFNDAVVTNTTRHRLGENFVTVGLWQPERAEYKISASPNPFSETTVLEIKGLTSSAPIHLLIIDIHGKIVHEETAPGPVLTLRKQELPNGMYLFRLDQQGAMIGIGKLIVQE